MSRLPIMMRRKGRWLVPADAWAEEQFDALPENKELSVKITVMSARGKTQREGLRGLWWAGLEVLAQNTENIAWDTKEKAARSVLTAMGFVRPRADGGTEPVSTAEGSMGDEEFALLLERARAYVVRTHGFDPWEMWQQERQK